MDISPIAEDPTPETLSYDDSISYSEQVAQSNPFSDVAEPEPTPRLADRIGNTKVYLLPETAGTRAGKRKREVENDEAGEDPSADATMGEDVPYRDNAILLTGSPISHLPTSNLFAYASHFDAHPMGLEWIDDTTCVLVFPTPSAARTAFRHLTKSAVESPGEGDNALTARPIPIALWPPEERINKSLGKGDGLKGVIRMRWATTEDVKKKGSRTESQFYKKYGQDAGKEGYVDTGSAGERHPQKRRRGELDDQIVRARLDDELDAFLEEDESEATRRPPSPPSKMYADRIGSSGKTLLERTSVMRARPDTLASRLTMDIIPTEDEREIRPLPRERGGQGGRRRGGDLSAREHGWTERPRKTAQDLDDELDAFLNAKD